MENSEQRLWWLPLARRMMGWGLAMACMWGWFPFLFGGEIGLLLLLRPEIFEGEDSSIEESLGPVVLVLAFIIPLAITCLWAIGGAITGIFTAYFAPTTEPKNPLKSPFFRSVGRQTFWFWLGSSIGSSFCYFLFVQLMGELGVLDRLVRQGIWHLSYGVYLASLVASPALSLWCALNRALAASKTDARKKSVN